LALKRALIIFVLSMGAALICAFVFVVMLQFSLPPSDWAYHTPVSRLFSDPFVFFGAIYGGIFFGIISFPFSYLAVRDLRLMAPALFIFGTVLCEILMITPFAGWLGLFGSVPTLVIALLICRFSGWQIFLRRSDCPRSIIRRMS
jgi:hypothetical protein